MSGGKGKHDLSDPAGSKDTPSTADTPSIAAEHKRPKPAKRGSMDDVSISLRQAYQSTLEEQVPDSIMDLLRQLD